MEIILEIFPPLLSCIRSCCWAAWGGGGRSAANVSLRWLMILSMAAEERAEYL